MIHAPDAPSPPATSRALAFRRLRDVARTCAAAPDLPAALAVLDRELKAAFGPEAGVVADTAVLQPGTGAGQPAVLLTLGPVGGRLPVIRLPGAWPRAWEQTALARLRDLLALALQAPAARGEAARAAALVGAAYGFARKLAQARDPADLRQLIVETIAGAVSAEQGSLALYDDAEGLLRIVATRGYPAVLVEHLRIAPGRGLLGRVYENRQALVVENVTRLPGHTSRRRYRTPSCLALPLLAQGAVIGIVSLADRADGRAFSRADLTAARALAAPAALALHGDRLAARARELSHAATIDPLTGLFNRRYFATRIEEEIERARRYSLELSLLLIDIDDFKRLNDDLGHLAGDQVLRQVADVLRRSVRVFDVCTRFGGEEFAILMPGSGVTNALTVAERIRARVEQAARELVPLPLPRRLTVSLGLASLGTDAGPQELIARADRALYRAKAEGKNCVRVEP